MDKETLSNYGWIVICVMVLAVMLAFASPFGNFVADAIKSTTQGLFDVNQGALDAANIHIMQQEFENMLGDKDPALNPTGAIISDNTYSYGDYVYSRNIVSGNPYGVATLDEAWSVVNAQLAAEGVTWEEVVTIYAQYGITEDQLLIEYGLHEDTFEPSVYGKNWNVSLNLELTDRNQTAYGPILESINGMPITNVSKLFYQCNSLITAPQIPNSVTDMTDTFFECTSLETLPVIPNSTTTFSSGVFYYCSSLSNIVIRDGITSIESNAIMWCTGIKNIVIPDSVKTLKNHALYCCKELTEITIGTGVTAIEECALGDNDNLKTINYKGTKEQWNGITLTNNWNVRCGEITVNCTDGSIVIPAWSN